MSTRRSSSPVRRSTPLTPTWSTAALSGTPTEIGEYQVVLRVTDRAGAFTEQAFTITVAEKPRHYIWFLPLVLSQDFAPARLNKPTNLAKARVLC